jgi:DNA-binding LytR/AlgR family response regulator
MKMLSIAVCDDEIIECCNMEKRIKKIIEEMKIPCIIRQFRSGGELLQALESFDIVFLDIMMPEMDGMKTAQLFRKKVSDKILIFVSSSREYVFEAYDVEAFQYLLKPVEDRKLKSVLQKAVLKTERRSQEFIIVSSQRQKKKLFLDDIYYFEIKGRIVDAHGPEGIFTYYEQMGELENKLQDKGFFRCHKSYLVNLKYVDGYNRQEAILENGERIVIAKRRYEDFCQEVLKAMRENGGID